MSLLGADGIQQPPVAQGPAVLPQQRLGRQGSAHLTDIPAFDELDGGLGHLATLELAIEFERRQRAVQSVDPGLEPRSLAEDAPQQPERTGVSDHPILFELLRQAAQGGAGSDVQGIGQRFDVHRLRGVPDAASDRQR